MAASRAGGGGGGAAFTAICTVFVALGFFSCAFYMGRTVRPPNRVVHRTLPRDMSSSTEGLDSLRDAVS